jgi:uncharacterized protein (TIGR00369 family)
VSSRSLAEEAAERMSGISWNPGEGAAPVVVEGHVITELGIRTLPSDEADLVMEMDCTPQRVNIRGGLQGGLIATLVDVVAGMASLDGCPDGHVPTTTTLAVTYLASIQKGPARATARIVRRGRRSVVVQVDVHDAGNDRLAAVSTVSFLVVPVGSTEAETPLSS